MTVTGRNLRFIRDEVPNCDPMTIKISDMKKTAKFCELDMDDCSDGCNNLPGSYECVCDKGFALDPDNATCAGISMF